MSGQKFFEANFDGIVGPTHSYAGLAFGNLASELHRNQTSHPKQAALQGLNKMKWLADLGIPQGVIPPLTRPNLRLLHQLGFRGTDREILEQAFKTHPTALAAAFSSSNMWTANAATVSPSPDSLDGKTHFTPANLMSSLHRSIEAEETTKNLRTIFGNENHFSVHQSLPCVPAYSDEGAANHIRLTPNFGTPAWEVFVYGADTVNKSAIAPSKYPARQSRLASEAVARLHQLNECRTFFVQQLPSSIDAGVFHNDVISVGHLNVLLIHEEAFVDQANRLKSWRRKFEEQFQTPLELLEIKTQDLSVEEAVSTYLFNSQIISRCDEEMILIAPAESEANPRAKECIERILAAPNPISECKFFDLRESMNNGGGPACLRLRVVLNEESREAVLPGAWLDDSLYNKLIRWIETHYRDEVHLDDLQDPNWIDETESCLEALKEIVGWPA